MKRLALALLSLLPLQALAFEGRVSFKITNPKGISHSITYSIKGKKTRMDMATPKLGMLSLIIDEEAGRSILLVEEKKEAQIRPFKELPVPAHAQGTFEPTGRHAQILGYACDEFKLSAKNAGQNMTLMAAKGLGSFRSLQNGPMSRRITRPAWEKKLMDEGYFPLRIDEGGTVTEATSIEIKNLPDSLFEAPAGYQKSK